MEVEKGFQILNLDLPLKLSWKLWKIQTYLTECVKKSLEEEREFLIWN